ncbi:biotin/lipoate A/B protein ligase [Thermosipho africanus Ob7]|uniref:lipoate--protein ligase family protein n=1 Tax=Thermosipho africanus TaxID=2421 RepID=UPI000E0CA1D1|nr:biotin/lipoate A/B protein ligase family protein [Thermosipho africanus]RDI92434.1 biotin/lipoate A/B protein ligase [Thermosipho africanus Ob7]
MFYIETWKIPGDLNMAIDYVLGKSQSSYFRLYTWKNPTLSLGKNQSVDVVNTTYLKENGIDCVKRPTGGRAVLHSKELTYSFIIPNTDPLFRLSVLKLYKEISTIIVEALNNIGIPAEIVSHSSRGNTQLCFDAPSWYEIVLNGKKIIGSAQMRTKSFVLQHGSIVLKTTTGIEKCFKDQSKPIIQYGLDLAKEVDIEELKNSLYKSFSKRFQLKRFENVNEIISLAENERMKFKCCI